MNHEEKLIEIIKDNKGLILSSQVDQLGIPRIYLSILVKKGFIKKIERGVYLTVDAFDDEMFRIQARYRKGIYSHGTALYLHDLTDTTPNNYTMTFPNRYHVKSLKEEGIFTFYVHKNLHDIGKVELLSSFGRNISTYNIERTIVDIVRSRNQIDTEMLNNALKRYVVRKDNNITMLMKYAKLFKVEKIIRQFMEILL